MKEEDFQTDRATPNILHVDTGTTNNNQSLNLEHTRYKWQPLTSEPGRHARYDLQGRLFPQIRGAQPFSAKGRSILYLEHSRAEDKIMS